MNERAGGRAGQGGDKREERRERRWGRGRMRQTGEEGRVGQSVQQGCGSGGGKCCATVHCAVFMLLLLPGLNQCLFPG